MKNHSMQPICTVCRPRLPGAGIDACLRAYRREVINCGERVQAVNTTARTPSVRRGRTPGVGVKQAMATPYLSQMRTSKWEFDRSPYRRVLRAMQSF